MLELLRETPQPDGDLHLPRGIAERRTLGRAEILDIGFEMESPGLIIAVAAAGAWKEAGQLLPSPREGDHAPHKIELFPPGDGTTAAAEVSNAPESNLVHEVTHEGIVRGRWVARLTNLSSTSQDFGFFVSYPGTRELREADFSVDDFADLGRLHLELHRGHQASSMTFETSAGPVTHYFTVPDIEYSCPWMPRVMAYFENLRSTAVRVSIPAGTPDPLFRYEFDFDDNGTEIAGTLPLDLRNMRLTVDLPVIVRYFKGTQSRTLSAVGYEEADTKVHFSFEPRFQELVEWFPGFFATWRRLIQRTVENACRELLAAAEIRQMFSDVMHARVLERLGESAKPVGVSAADGKLRISYYTV
jgi:hypothetical protein